MIHVRGRAGAVRALGGARPGRRRGHAARGGSKHERDRPAGAFQAAPPGSLASVPINSLMESKVGAVELRLRPRAMDNRESSRKISEMRRALWRRILSAVCGLWLTAVLGEPAALHACSKHDAHGEP